jgi:hypothetical protein
MDEHEHVVSRVIKRQSFEEDFEQKAKGYESIFKNHTMVFESRYNDIKYVKDRVDEKYN